MHRPSFLRFLFVCLLLVLLGWRVVWPQIELITDGPLFALIFIVLLGLSFLSSAMEAALTSAAKQDALLADVREEKSEAILERNTLLLSLTNGGGSEELWKKEDQDQMEALRSKSKVLEFKAFTISEEGRGVSVGAFASLSVFLNIALASFLPLVLLNNADSIVSGRVGLYYPTVQAPGGGGVLWDFLFWDFSGSKLFVFVVTAIPLLLLGKIVPKEVGSRNYDFFAIGLNRFVRFIVRWLGWLPAGALWLLSTTKKN